MSRLSPPMSFPIGWIALLALTMASPDGADKRSWNFESDETGKIAKGFTNELGRWVVEQVGKNRVLAQKAENDDETFNVALIEGTSYTDLDISVRLRSIAGKFDQGGGLVWRAKDKDNYYIARYNPLEDNIRFYKVQDGKRTLFVNAKVPGDNEWHTLRCTMVGPKIHCYFDGERQLEWDDSTFTGAGRIGLWSKSDARSHFDDLTVKP